MDECWRSALKEARSSCEMVDVGGIGSDQISIRGPAVEESVLVLEDQVQLDILAIDLTIFL